MFSVNGAGFLLYSEIARAVWYRFPSRHRWVVMLAANILFYLSLDIPGFFVLLACALVVWWCARRMAPDSPSHSRWLAVGLVAALGPLLLLKYYAMFAGTLNSLLGLSVWEGQGLIQPLGLAYYSLQLTYSEIARHRGEIPAEPNFARVLCYTSFFLSITQGPFNRYGTWMTALDTAPDFSGQRLKYGLARMAWGYFKKYAIAERLAVAVDSAFHSAGTMDRSQLIFGVIAFAFQLYADFSGYTDIVLGAGEAMGLTLPENFRQPYLSATIGEFWSAGTSRSPIGCRSMCSSRWSGPDGPPVCR